MFNKLMEISVENGPYSPYSKDKNKQSWLNEVGNENKSSNDSQIIDKSNKSMSLSGNESYVSRESSKMRSTSLHHNYLIENIKKSRMIEE